MELNSALTKDQKHQRLQALFNLAGQRYKEAGGDPKKSASCNVYLTHEEQQEFKTLTLEVSAGKHS